MLDEARLGAAVRREQRAGGEAFHAVRPFLWVPLLALAVSVRRSRRVTYWLRVHRSRCLPSLT